MRPVLYNYYSQNNFVQQEILRAKCTCTYLVFVYHFVCFFTKRLRKCQQFKPLGASLNCIFGLSACTNGIESQMFSRAKGGYCRRLLLLVLYLNYRLNYISYFVIIYYHSCTKISQVKTPTHVRMTFIVYFNDILIILI